MEALPIKEVARILNADVVGDDRWTIKSIAHDTRLMDGSDPHPLFFAFKGGERDGHDYVRDALRIGAEAVVVARAVEDVNITQLVVRDPLAALWHLAKWYRQNLGQVEMVGITGSVAKTTTKQMAGLALDHKNNVHWSQNKKVNFNSEIGLPISVMDMERHHKVGVFELGMRGPEQITQLCDICEPTIGAITNIGLSHVEFLGSRKEIAKAKAELLRCLPNDGTAIIPEGDYLEYFQEEASCVYQKTFGSSPKADYRLTDYEYTPNGWSRFKVNGKKVEIYACGAHFAVNATIALAIADTLGVPLEEAADRLRQFKPLQGRGNGFQHHSGAWIVDDAYNAAPDSMEAGINMIEAYSKAHGHKPVLILGGMNELGAESDWAHEYVGKLVSKLKPRLLLTVGRLALKIQDSVVDLPSDTKRHFEDVEDLKRSVRDLVLPTDAVLIKGSRTIGLDEIVDIFYKGKKEPKPYLK